MKISKAVSKVILVGFACICNLANAQKCAISLPEGKALYVDSLMNITIEVDGLTSDQYTVKIGEKTLKGHSNIYPVYAPEAIIGTEVELKVIGNDPSSKVIATRKYFVAQRMPFRIFVGTSSYNSLVDVQTFLKNKGFTVVGGDYSMVKYSCAIVPKKENATFFAGVGALFSEAFLGHLSAAKSGDKVIFDEIFVVNNKTGEKIKAPAMVFTIL